MGGFIPTCHTQAVAEMTKVEITMSKIVLNYRPISYFSYKKLGIPVDEIKGAVRRHYVKQALQSGVYDLDPIFLKSKLSEDERCILSRIHPAFMGGEYLPDTDLEEVEIARITIASTTHDVACIYTSFKGDKYHYRIVDEYDGDTIEGLKKKVSKKPLTLKVLMDFFLKGWDIFCFLDLNFAHYNYDRDKVKVFIIEASSNFYSQFGDLLDQRIDDWLLKVTRKEEDAD